jgi:hypothetical protein
VRLVGLGLAVVLSIGADSACRTRETREAVAYWRKLRSESVVVTRRFLNAAAAGDSSGLAAVATDSVVREVLHYHRLSAARHLRSAAKTFDETKVVVYGSASEVQFTYTDGGLTYQGDAFLRLEKDSLKVAHFGAPTKID